MEPSTTPAAPIATAGPQTPLDRLKSLGIRDGADAALVVDGDKVRASLVGSVLAPLMEMGRQFFTLACGMSPLDDVKLAAGSFTVKGEHLYAAIETKHSAREWVRCVQRLTKHVAVEEGKPLPPAEDTLFEGGDVRIEALDEHTVVVSSRGEGPMRPNAIGRFASLSLAGDRMLEAQGDIPIDDFTLRSVRLDVGGNPESASLHLALDLPDGKGPELSKDLDTARRKIASGSGSREKPLVQWLFDHVKYSISADHLEANLALGRPDVTALVDLGSQLLGRETRGYAASGKASEARSTLRMMAASTMSWFENEVPDPKHPGTFIRQTKCPPSAPLTPTKVPKGDTYQSKASDWSKGTWSTIHFSITSPQRYAYGIDTSKDGKTCTFYAVGDVDGNGKRSRFELHGKVTAPPAGRTGAFPALSIGPAFIETSPNE